MTTPPSASPSPDSPAPRPGPPSAPPSASSTRASARTAANASVEASGRTTRGAAAPGDIDLAAVRRRTQMVLVISQILGGLGVAVSLALAAVLAEEISGSRALAGLATTSSVLGTAVLSLPLASLMAARGRRPGLTLAYAIGAVGGGVVVLAAVVESFPLLLLGMAAFGAGSSANLQARFSAADLAAPDQRGRAIAMVVWATTIGAVTGPNIAGPAGRSVSGLGIPEAAGPFAWGAAIFVVAALVVWSLLRPDPLLTAQRLAGHGADGARPKGGRSLRAAVAAVRASPRARLAFVTITGAHTAMVSVMVMTPVDLTHHGADIELVGLVLSGHIAGMYAFSPVMGRLADAVGRISVIGLGVALLACATLLAGTSGGSHAQSAAGLFLLGLGWSAGLVAGSALLTDSVPAQLRPSVQGLSDLSMNACAGLGGAASGLVVAGAGYGLLNALAAALLLPVAALALLGRGPGGPVDPGDRDTTTGPDTTSGPDTTTGPDDRSGPDTTTGSDGGSAGGTNGVGGRQRS
ncbi:MFS transporter [Streptomyces sp. XM4193]|uniref:MFS transporter n=1 Tax=Streptomyces sp. XM4193 TaxID=2929782 RepID=UPI001FFBEA71|nr:MFS transporter [Streptomyces sp. XM4193]MCK1796454.1 MFS transporter [Streptomyces sp. XM4193]